MFQRFNLMWVQRKAALNTLADIAALSPTDNDDLQAVVDMSQGYFITQGLERTKYQTDK